MKVPEVYYDLSFLRIKEAELGKEKVKIPKEALDYFDDEE